VDFLKTVSVCVPVPDGAGVCAIDQVLTVRGSTPYFWQRSVHGLARIELRKDSESHLRLVCSSPVKSATLDGVSKASLFPGKSACLIGGPQPCLVDAASATFKPVILPGCVVDAVELDENWYVLMKIGTGGLLVQRLSGDLAVNSVRLSVECPETPKQLSLSLSSEGTTLWLLTDSSIRALECDSEGKKLSLGPNLLQTGDQLEDFRYGCTRFKKPAVILPPYFVLLGDGVGKLLDPRAQGRQPDCESHFDGSTFRVIQRSTSVVALNSNCWCSLGEDRSITLLEVPPKGPLRITESFSDSDGAISGVVAVCQATPSFFAFVNDEGSRLFVMEKSCALCESYQEVMECDDIFSNGSSIVVSHAGGCYLLGDCEAVQLPIQAEKLLVTSSSHIDDRIAYFVTAAFIAEVNSGLAEPRYHRPAHPILAAAFSSANRDVLAFVSDSKLWVLDGGEGTLEFGKEKIVTTLSAQVRTLCFSVDYSVLLVLWGGEAIRVSKTGTVAPVRNEQTVPCAVASAPILVSSAQCALDVIGTTDGSLLLFIDEAFKEKVQISIQPLKQVAISESQPDDSYSIFALSTSSLHFVKFTPNCGRCTEVTRVLSVEPSSMALTKDYIYLVLDSKAGCVPIQHFTECNPLPLVSKELDGFSSAVRYPRSDLVAWLQTNRTSGDCDTIATLNPFCSASAALYRSASAGYLDLQCVRVRDGRSWKDYVVGIGRQINVFLVNPCGKLKQVSSIVCKVNSFPVWTVGIEFRNTVVVMNQRYVGVLDFQSPHKLSRLFEYCADETVSSLVVSVKVSPDDNLSLLVTYDNSTESTVSLLPVLDVFAT
jgi:hypothetical protein